jgi:preprotein translocase subunit SecA
MEEQWDLPGLENVLANEWGLTVDLQQWVEGAESIDDAQIVERVLQAAKDAYDAKVELSGRDSFASFERSVLLYSVDTHWREHLAALDHLRQGIHLRGYAQKDPKQEYRREAFELYGELLDVIKNDVVKSIMTVQIRSASELDRASESMNEDLAKLKDLQYQHADADMEVAGSTGDRGAAIDIQPAPARSGPKVGRNDPCPCGSGKKYKNCCGALT